MNFRHLFILFIFFSNIVYSQGYETRILQQKSNSLTFKVNFKQVKYKILGKTSSYKKIDFYEYTDPDKEGSPKIPNNTFYVALPPNSKIKNISVFDIKKDEIKKSLPIANPSLISINDTTIKYVQRNIFEKYLQSNEFPSTNYKILGYTWIRNIYCAVIQINTYKVFWLKKQIEFIAEAKIKITFENSKPFQHNSSLSLFDKENLNIFINPSQAKKFATYHKFPTRQNLFDWINFGDEYIKLGIVSDGLYKIDYNDLVTYCVEPSSINLNNLKIYFKGNEIPIYVSSNSSDVFDENSFLIFYAEKNYADSDYTTIVKRGEDYKLFLDRYSDTSYVWLTWGNGTGKRLLVDSTFSDANDTISTFTQKLHYEKDTRFWYYDNVTPRINLPFWQENKTWTWQQVSETGTRNFNFEAVNFIPDSTFIITARYISYGAGGATNGVHKYTSIVNSNVSSDTIVFDYKQTVNYQTSFSTNFLNENQNNFKVKGLDTYAQFAQILVDWFDVNYPAYIETVNDTLVFSISEEVENANRIIRITGLTHPVNEYYLVKVRGRNRKISINFIQANNNSLIFSDTVNYADKYALFHNEKLKKPIFIQKKTFENLVSSDAQCDYIIIIHPTLSSSTYEYQNFISQNFDVTPKLFFINDIYDQFNFGIKSAESIKDFLIYAYNNWQSPKPSFLMLIGSANYDYYHVLAAELNPPKIDLLPSFGYPVSDVWFTMFDSTDVNLQQLYVGRIPAGSNEEVSFYFNKLTNYLNRKYDDFNKRFLCFSGGDPNASGDELALFRNTNEVVINNYFERSPIGGMTSHFYKTTDPPTNYGPFPLSYVENEINKSSVAISYLGHSGTQTWDNGITSVSDLASSSNDRFPLIADFGCSSGRFAEPDVRAFAASFVSCDENGQAIAYYANSSFGYTSTSVTFPQIFFNKILHENLIKFGQAHFAAKVSNFSQNGYSDVNRVFNYCNLLFGDPIISLAIPTKPNFIITGSDIKLMTTHPDDTQDSLLFRINYVNLGKVPQDTLTIGIYDYYNDLSSRNFSRTLKVPVPLNYDTLFIKIPTNNLIGKHTLRIVLDDDNNFDEIYEDDNLAEFSYNIYSTQLRAITNDPYYATVKDSIKIILPTVFSLSDSMITLTFSDNKNIDEPLTIKKKIGEILTKVPVSDFSQSNKRYWYEMKFENSNNYSSPNSYVYFPNRNLNWYIDSLYNRNDIIDTNQINFDDSLKGWKLVNKENLLKITSAGANDGGYGSFIFNGMEMNNNTIYWGLATAIIDSVTLKPSDVRIFAGLPRETNSDSLISYLNRIPNGTYVAFAISLDACQTVIGYHPPDSTRQLIKQFGSAYIDSVEYRDSWCMIGKKGAQMGSVPEDFRKKFLGPAVVTLRKSLIVTNGRIEFPLVGNSSRWNKVYIESNIPEEAALQIIMFGENNSSNFDSLSNYSVTSDVDSFSIAKVDPQIYNKLKFTIKMQANNNYESPILYSLGVNYTGLAELGTNYQVVSLEQDSVDQGENVNLNFRVYNVGETVAQKFNVKVDLVRTDNSSYNIFSQTIDSLNVEQYKQFDVVYNTANFKGEGRFKISIDDSNVVTEYYEDNNYYSIPFYVIADTSKPELEVTFDDEDILDGQYISPTPTIRIELSDNFPLAITDTSTVTLLLNEENIYFNNPARTDKFSDKNPKYVVTFKPKLKTGDYTLYVNGKDANGNFALDNGIVKHFKVSTEPRLLEVYNYPNPFATETYFTFKLTQLPEKMYIKIYTIAGRLIRKIELNESNLRYDFNRIYWDGLDEDGDAIANGVYIYKVISYLDGKTYYATQKLAIVR